LGLGGVHQSKTMMLRELSSYMDASATIGGSPKSLVMDANVLGKATGSARKLALERLRGLYAISMKLPIARVLEALWRSDAAGRPMLAILCSLARDPLLRESADVVLPAPLGEPVRWPRIAAAFEARHPARFSEKMRKSLSQNCASSWTQSGHLKGKIKKLRTRATPSAPSAAYAALLATIAGFGGPALLGSPWLLVLDRPLEDRLTLLRQAESQGLVRVRAAGDTVEIMVRQSMARALGIPDLGDL
jgi:hypothetical protein